MRSICLGLLLLCTSFSVRAQSAPPIDESQWGAWYMYIYNTTFGEGPWGLQGDLQYRNFNLLGDMNQLLIRSGATYKHNKVKYTLGYAHITNSAFGLDSVLALENRIYQEALIPQRISRLRMTHRLRAEQRWIGEQSNRGRFRYALFVNVPLGDPDESKWYLSFYDEVFINARWGSSAASKYFDRNRLYGAVGYSVSSKLKLQVGVMNRVIPNYTLNQWQLNLIQKI